VRTRFGSFTLDTETRQLESEREIHLSPKAFDVLCMLLEGRPGVIGKAAIHARIWPGTFVVDANLSVIIGEIRRALGDTPHDEKFIRTVHRVGYAFCAEATDLASRPSPGERAPAATSSAHGIADGTLRCWLVWNDRRFVLGVGEHFIGRDPVSAVWLDASGVSRNHACIRIDGDGHHASIEDLGSTNGTFLRGLPIVARAALRDGDIIQIGAAELVFRAWPGGKPPVTERIRRTKSR
jgi:DNA-binding winged helix-turn-helix (wHTH) protein